MEKRIILNHNERLMIDFQFEGDTFKRNMLFLDRTTLSWDREKGFDINTKLVDYIPSFQHNDTLNIKIDNLDKLLNPEVWEVREDAEEVPITKHKSKKFNIFGYTISFTKTK